MRTEDAVKYAGNKLLLCKLLGISRMSVTHWGYWVPEKHARTISKMDGCDLAIDEELYAGKVQVIYKEKTYTPAIKIKSTALLGKAMASGLPLFFFTEAKIMIPASRLDGDIFSNFRKLPLYEEVK